MSNINLNMNIHRPTWDIKLHIMLRATTMSIQNRYLIVMSKHFFEVRAQNI